MIDCKKREILRVREGDRDRGVIEGLDERDGGDKGERQREVARDRNRGDVLSTPQWRDDLINTPINHGWQWRIYLTCKPGRVQNQQFISRRNSDHGRSIRAPNLWLPVVAIPTHCDIYVQCT